MDIAEITLATQNSGKVYEITLALGGLPVRLQTLADKGILEQDPEHGVTLLDNAEAKALHAHRLTNDWVMSDDSGIFPVGLPNKAGVHTKEWIDGRDDPAVFEEFLRAEFKGIRNRFAVFTAVIVLIEPDHTIHRFRHSVPGTLVLDGRGERIPHLPLCRHFIPHSQSKTLSEMSPEEFGRYSHRSIALRNARVFLENYLKKNTIHM